MRGTDLRIRCKLVSGHKVGRQDDLDIVLLGLFHQRVDLLGSVLVIEGVADAHAVQDLLEGECHSAADDEGVDLRERSEREGGKRDKYSASSIPSTTASQANLVQHVINQLQLIRNLCAAQNRQKRPLRVLQRFRKVLQLLLHQEPSGPLLQLDTDHGRVRSVCGSERVVDVDRSEVGK